MAHLLYPVEVMHIWQTHNFVEAHSSRSFPFFVSPLSPLSDPSSAPVCTPLLIFTTLQGVRRPALPDYLEVKKYFAVHECGKALVATKLREKTGRLEQVERVSIVPRGRSAALLSSPAARLFCFIPLGHSFEWTPACQASSEHQHLENICILRI